MDLDDYLMALDNCSDEKVRMEGFGLHSRLTLELGVFDNWPILLNANFAKVVNDLQKSNYVLESKNDEYTYFSYKPGTMMVQVWNRPIWTTTGVDAESKFHEENQKKEFNMSLLLQPYQNMTHEGKTIKGVTKHRAIAMVIKDIAEYAKRESIPLCFPHSIGLKNMDDCSRIVYFNPRTF